MNKMRVDPNIKNLEDYFLDPNDTLFVKIEDDKAELRTDEEVLVIPHTLQKQAISIIHDTVIGGHTAAERTLFAARRRFFWRGMASAIKKYVAQCKSCRINKGRPHQKQPLRKYPLPDKTFDVVSTDLIGPLTQTVKGNRYILVVTDFLSRYAVVKALESKKADVVAGGLWSIFCEHGVPSVSYPDSGCQYRNAIM